MRTADALNSAVPDLGSMASMVSRLVSTSSGKCIVMNTRPGRSAGVDAHRRDDVPRRDDDPHLLTVLDARAAASSGETSIVSPKRSGERTRPTARRCCTSRAGGRW